MSKKEINLKKKIFILIFIIFSIFLLIFILHTIKNFFIIKELQKNFLKYENSRNYHISSIDTTYDLSLNHKRTIVNYYLKDGKQHKSTEYTTSNGQEKKLYYKNGKIINYYMETETEKIANLDISKNGTRLILFGVSFPNQFEDEESLLWSILGKISETSINKKDCYKIDNLMFPIINSESTIKEFYVEKETGLLLKIIFGRGMKEYEYEFDNIDDSVFAEPNIEDYRVEIFEL